MNAKPNVDPEELKKFNQSAFDWWDDNGAFRTLHHINPPRLQLIQDTIDLTSSVCLDVGCGGGILAESMAAAGATVTAIDLAEDALTVAKQHAESQQITVNYQCISIEELSEQEPERFDVVTCMEMLEHVPDPAAIVSACAQAVKPGGYCFFSTLNRTLKAYLLAIVGAEYILGLLPKRTHDYDKFIRPAELASLCRTAGLNVNSTIGMHYNPMTKQASLIEDIGVNYFMICQKR